MITQEFYNTIIFGLLHSFTMLTLKVMPLSSARSILM